MEKKQATQRQRIPEEGWGYTEQASDGKKILLFVFAVRVVSHSAVEERSMAASRLARPLRTSI